MATHIVDETPASFAPALKATLCELLAQAPAELLTGVRKIILLTSVTDPKVLHASGNVSSQYLYKDGAAIIHIYLANIDRKRWRLIPLSWRPWSRARLLTGALSYPLAHQKSRGKPENRELLRNDARKIQALLLRRWVASWVERYPAGDRLKDLFRRYMEARIRRFWPGGPH